MGLFFGFRGRINRGKYWLGVIVWMLVWIVTFVVLFVSLSGDGGDADMTGDRAVALLAKSFGWLLLLAALFVLSWWSTLALGMKRLHDRDKSGWWIVLFMFGPSVLGALQTYVETDGANLVLSVASLAIAVWAFIELGCLRGTDGPNRYGPDPLSRTAAFVA